MIMDIRQNSEYCQGWHYFARFKIIYKMIDEKINGLVLRV